MITSPNCRRLFQVFPSMWDLGKDLVCTEEKDYKFCLISITMPFFAAHRTPARSFLNGFLGSGTDDNSVLY